jgi:hypothetical protein
MSAKSYTIRHNGHIISREGDVFHVSTTNGDVDTVALPAGKYCCDGVTISDGNAWIGDTLVVQDGGALCYSIHYAGYTITRSAGSLKIAIKGHAIQNPDFEDSMQTFGENSVSIHDGTILVDSEQLVHNGMLFAHGEDMTEAEARSTAQLNPDLRPVNSPSTGKLLYNKARGLYTLSRYPDSFVYNVPQVRGSLAELKAKSDGYDDLWNDGVVWLGPIPAIRDYIELYVTPDDE